MLRTSLPAPELATYVAAQATAFFPDGVVDADDLRRPVAAALERAERCFSKVNLKYYRMEGTPYLDHLHTDQYAMFLYLLANSIHRDGGDARLAAKVYALNKALHGLDVYYEVELPEVFAFQHPVGTVLGRARYGDGLFVYQRCSVGANLSGEYPTIGEGVVMFGGSAVIGASTVGDGSWLSVGTIVLDDEVPPRSVVFGRSPHLTIKPTTRDVMRELFRVE